MQSMRSRGLRIVLALSCLLLLAVAASAASLEKAKKPVAKNDHSIDPAARGAGLAKAGGPNITYHGGPTITSAKVVLIFWGPSFSNAASPDFVYAPAIQAFRTQCATTPEYNTITQYSGIQLSNLVGSQADWFDTSTPPTNVTDAIVQSEVNAYLAMNGGNNASTVYEVFIPSSSYSSSGSSTSCGGPNLQY